MYICIYYIYSKTNKILPTPTTPTDDPYLQKG